MRIQFLRCGLNFPHDRLIAVVCQLFTGQIILAKTYGIDGHKLHYHVARVSDWLEDKNIYPVYMEISPTGACNHRCSFCGVDYLGYQVRSLDKEILKERLGELGAHGLKSVMYCGEGEPLLHKHIGEIVNHTKQSKIDVAITTNGVLLTEKLSEQILGDLEWIKVSFNAGTKETYKKVNGAKDSDFDLVLRNLKKAVKIRGQNNYNVTLGMQMILLPENESEVGRLAQIAKDIGLDYLVIKPYSQNTQSVTIKYNGLTYDDLGELEESLAQYNTDSFTVIVRSKALEKSAENKKTYDKCLALPFWAYIDSGGGVWGCLDYIGDDRFYYGNINAMCIKNIWEGEQRLKLLKCIEKDFNPDVCRGNCRMDEVNRYLWTLRSDLPPHVNFI